MEPMEQQTVLPDDRAQASNPAAVPLSKGLWIRHYPLWPCVWMLLAIVPFAMTMGLTNKPLQATSFVVFLLMLGVNWGYWLRLKVLFEHGDTLPGVVIATSPTRVAVLADMTKGEGYYPAVKVVKVPLKQVLGRPVQPGLGLAMVTLYDGSQKDGLPYWKDIQPVPIESGTADPPMINAVLAQLTEDDWKRLEKAVAALPSEEPGLFRMHSTAH